MIRAALIALLLFTGIAHAQVPAVAALTWAAPAAATDGTPLTGAQALTEYQLFVSQSAILDTSAAAPTAKLPPDKLAYQYAASVANGTRLYFRLKACNVGGCSAFSPEVSKVVAVAAPGAPGAVSVGVTITVTVTP